MKLTAHDLKQMNKSTLARLSPEQLLLLSERMLDDLQEAMDRLNQNSDNSSRPPSSTLPWNTKDSSDAGDQANHDDATDDEMKPVTAPCDEQDEDLLVENAPLDNESRITGSTGNERPEEIETPPTKPTSKKRQAGKQEGSQGYGRTQTLAMTDIAYHARTHCASCHVCIGNHETQVAWTAFYTIDIAAHLPGYAGITLTNTKHIFFEIQCNCGHHNREEPYVAMPDVTWPKTNISEWRLVGPRLAAMIVLLSKRHRNSRRLIREFLFNFLGLELSIGTIDQTIREAARSAAPLEDELIRDIEEASLAYVDETSWKEAGVLRWLWVFRTLTVVFFMVGKRDRTIFSKLLLNGRFKGIVMSDGWVVYREYANRLRCWIHLIRKARGLSESCHTRAADVGIQMLMLFTTFQNAIYAARNQPEQPIGTLAIRHENEIETLKALCIANRDSTHDKLRAFARELLGDWDIILRQIHDPSLPLTNNEAERILRHWVIDRRLSNGTRTTEGTRAFTVLASVIETCRIRGAPAWDYLTQVITAARKGLELPTLPLMQAG